MIIALAGRRVDAPEAEIRRFPVENIELVRQRLRELFNETEPKALISSAACGADLIALQEAGALGIRRRVILPFNRRRFRETSVIDRPGDWGRVYDRVLDEVESNGDLVTLSGDSDYTRAYTDANGAILSEAIALGLESKYEIRTVLVWDGAPRGEDDLTKMFANEAKARGFPIVEIKTV
jgi:hypothetical protein